MHGRAWMEQTVTRGRTVRSRAAKESILGAHLLPMLGTRRLDGISSEDVQQPKSELQGKAPKTVNNVLTVLNVLLKKAIEWDVIDRMPCSIRLLPVPRPSAAFHDFADYERLARLLAIRTRT